MFTDFNKFLEYMVCTQRIGVSDYSIQSDVVHALYTKK